MLGLSCICCISHKLSTVRTCAKWSVLHSIKQMKHANSQSWDDGTLSLGQLNPSHEKLSQCSFSGGQLDVLVSAMTEVPRLRKEHKTSSGLARLRRRQDSLHMPDTCFLFEFISHPTVKVFMSKGMKSVSSVKNLTTNGFIRMTYWYSNHPKRSICRTSGIESTYSSIRKYMHCDASRTCLIEPASGF